MININNNFGAILKQIRESLNMSLSDVNGVTDSYISRLENGLRSNPTVSVVTTLATNYNIAPTTLFKIISGIQNEQSTSLNDILLKNDLIINGEYLSGEIKLMLVEILTLILNTEFNRTDEAMLLSHIDNLKKSQEQENENNEKIAK